MEKIKRNTPSWRNGFAVWQASHTSPTHFFSPAKIIPQNAFVWDFQPTDVYSGFLRKQTCGKSTGAKCFKKQKLVRTDTI